MTRPDHPDYTALPAEERVKVSLAIRRMRREGIAEDQAVAKALAMQRAGRLTEDGSYRRVRQVSR